MTTPAAPLRSSLTTTTTHPADTAETSTARPGRDRLKGAGVAAAFGAGLVSAVQSHVNGSLTAEVGNGIVVAAISFASATAILALLLLLVPKARRGVGRVVASVRAGRRNTTDAVRAIHRGVPGIGRLRWFQVIGGAAGGLFVIAQGVTVGSLGVAMFVVAVTAGQSVSSLFCDLLGFAPGGRRAITLGRAVGPALAIAAVLVAQWSRLGTASQVYLVALPMVAGVFVAAQHAVNGRVETTAATAPFGPQVDRMPGALAATFINFLVGTVALLVVVSVALVIQGWPTGQFPGEWWMYTGGLLGVVFIGTAAAVVHRIGALLLALSLIAGQITGAIVLDVTVRDLPLSTGALVAVALTLGAIAVPALTTRTSVPGH